jgi:hypothetical protein
MGAVPSPHRRYRTLPPRAAEEGSHLQDLGRWGNRQLTATVAQRPHLVPYVPAPLNRSEETMVQGLLWLPSTRTHRHGRWRQISGSGEAPSPLELLREAAASRVTVKTLWLAAGKRRAGCGRGKARWRHLIGDGGCELACRTRPGGLDDRQVPSLWFGSWTAHIGRLPACRPQKPGPLARERRGRSARPAQRGCGLEVTSTFTFREQTWDAAAALTQPRWPARTPKTKSLRCIIVSGNQVLPL